MHIRSRPKEQAEGLFVELKKQCLNIGGFDAERLDRLGCFCTNVPYAGVDPKAEQGP
jgi:hypothetical protein